MPKYELTCGIQKRPLRCVIYGVAGIGKSTLAAQFPNPVFIDVEDGSNQLPVARMPRPTSWEMLLDEVREVRLGNVPCSTLIIDTADAAEELCIKAVCAEHEWDGIQQPAHGRGYTYLYEKFAKLLDELGAVVDGGRNIVLVSHAIQRKIERPDEDEGYDHFELNLVRKVGSMTKEWADTLLFCDYQVFVETESDRKGNTIKAKAKGGKRVMRTSYHPCWDAKNRFGLKSELPLDYFKSGLAEIVPDMIMQTPTPTPAPELELTPIARQAGDQILRKEYEEIERAKSMTAVSEADPRDSYPDELKPLVDLMRADGISDHELRQAVAARGTFVYETPVSQYPLDFVQWLTSVWASFVEKVKEQRQLQA